MRPRSQGDRLLAAARGGKTQQQQRTSTPQGCYRPPQQQQDASAAGARDAAGAAKPGTFHAWTHGGSGSGGPALTKASVRRRPEDAQGSTAPFDGAADQDRPYKRFNWEPSSAAARDDGRDQGPAGARSSAGNDFLLRTTGRAGGGGGTSAPPRAPTARQLGVLGSPRCTFGGSVTPFSRTFSHGVVTTGSGPGAGRQAAITEFLGPGSGSGGGAPSLQVRLPAGMVNHGNTCYLNAVLQSLLSIPCFVSGLQSPRLAALDLPRDGLVAALQGCLDEQRAAAADGDATAAAGRPAPISPGRVRAVMARRSPRWGGARQEDAHEFLTELLETVQREVLGAQAEAAGRAGGGAVRGRRRRTTDSGEQQEREDQQQQQQEQGEGAPVELTTEQQQNQQQQEEAEGGGADEAAGWPVAPATRRVLSVRLSAAACPASRAFSGCLQHELRCHACGHVTTLKEAFSCLSLDLPASSDFGMKAVPLDALLAAFFAPEELEKSCDACGGAAVRHTLRHAVRRLPPVLVVHLKRFSVRLVDGVGAVCRKLSTPVAPAPRLDLSDVTLGSRPLAPPLAELAVVAGSGGPGEGATAAAAGEEVEEEDKENAGRGGHTAAAGAGATAAPAGRAGPRSRLAGMTAGATLAADRAARTHTCSTSADAAPPTDPAATRPNVVSPGPVKVGAFFGDAPAASGAPASPAHVGTDANLLVSPQHFGSSLDVLGAAAGTVDAAGAASPADGGDDDLARALAASMQTYQEERRRSQARTSPSPCPAAAAVDQQQQGVAVGGLSGGAAGAALSAGMHFSGGGCSGDGGGSGGGGDDHLPMLASELAPAAQPRPPSCAGDSGTFIDAATIDTPPPASPPGTPLPRDGSTTNSPTTAGRGLGRGGAAGGRPCSPIDLVLEDDEEEQIKKAMEASMLEYEQQQAAKQQLGGGNGEPAAGSGSGLSLGMTNTGSNALLSGGGAGADVPGSTAKGEGPAAVPAAGTPAAAAPPLPLVAAGEEDFEAQLQRVLAESEREYLEKQQQQQKDADGGDAEVVLLDDGEGGGLAEGSNALAGTAAAAAAGSSGPAGVGSGAAAPPRPLPPLVQLLEDSDQEESDGPSDSGSGDSGGAGTAGGEERGGAVRSGGKRRASDGCEEGGAEDDAPPPLPAGALRRRKRLASVAAAAGADASADCGAPMDVDGSSGAPTSAPLQPLQPAPLRQEQPPAADGKSSGKAAVASGGSLLQSQAAVYSLHAVVRHKGPLASSGHFVADVRSQQDPALWIHYDDSYVTTATQASVLAGCQTDGYLFFYINTCAAAPRRGGRPAAARRE